MDIIIHNSQCFVKGSNVDAKLSELLSYIDSSVNFEFQKKVKYVSSINRRIIKATGASKIQLEASRRKELYLLQQLENKRIICLYKDKSFPTGLLPMVEKLLNKESIEYTKVDKRVKPKLLKYKFVTKRALLKPRYYQKESEKIFYEKGRGIFLWPCGGGKSFTLSKIVWKLGLDTLVIAPSVDILEMIYDDLIEVFGKSKVSKLNTKSTKLKSINVVNIQAITKLDPKLFKSIDLVIIDEFHRSGALSYQEVNESHLKGCYYRLGLTATYDRPQGDMLALKGVLSDILYEYTCKQAFSDNYLVRPSFRIIGNHNPCTKRNYQTQYKHAIVNNVKRNNRIASIASDHKEDSIMILVKQIEHGKSLKDLIPNSEFVHGKEKSDNRKKIMSDFKSGKLKVLIGITSILGEGINLPIANVMIMAGGGKSSVQVIQNIGRVFRPYPGKDSAIVYDFKDIGSSYLEEHSLIRRKLYEMY